MKELKEESFKLERVETDKQMIEEFEEMIDRFEHEDEAQNQRFKWYQVKGPDDKIGWIYGDGLATALSTDEIPNALQEFHRRQFNFSDDLAATTIWIAGIEGKDNFYEDDYLNPSYKEYYIVLTSRLGKSYYIQ